MEENDQALLDWVNTFTLPRACTCLKDLSDGRVLNTMLSEISPDFFPKDGIFPDDRVVPDNWAISATNLRKLLRSLDDFYKTVLRKKIDMTGIDVEAIARTGDPESVLDLVELIVGAAVLCERKTTFIPVIFGLDHDSQTVLKGLVEHVMGEMGDYIEGEGGEYEGGGGHNGDGNNDGYKGYNGYINRDDAVMGEGGVSSVGGEGVRGDTRVQGEVGMNGIVPGGMVLGGMGGIERTGGDRGVEGSGSPTDELLRARELIRQLQADNYRITSLMSELGTERDHMRDAISAANEREKERDTAKQDSAIAIAVAAKEWNKTLQIDMDNYRREIDQKNVESEGLRSALNTAKMSIDASAGVIARFEKEASRMNDELDVDRDKGLRLIKAETQINKYQLKLEELNGLKKLNKELSGKNDEYLDKVHELEVKCLCIDQLRSQIEESKARNVSLERDIFEAVSACEVSGHELGRMGGELAAVQSARMMLEQELCGVREQALAQAQAAATAVDRSLTAATAITAVAGGGVVDKESDTNVHDDHDDDAIYEIESVASLRQRLSLLERELIRARSSFTGAETEIIIKNNTEIAILTAELSDLKKMKLEREEALLEVQRVLSETRVELMKVTSCRDDLMVVNADICRKGSKSMRSEENEWSNWRSNGNDGNNGKSNNNGNDHNNGSNGNSGSNNNGGNNENDDRHNKNNSPNKNNKRSPNKDSKSSPNKSYISNSENNENNEHNVNNENDNKCNDSNNETDGERVRLLRGSLTDKEKTINRLMEEKGKLELYAKRTLSTFKDKYMTALQTMKEEKRIIEEQLAIKGVESERESEGYRREEALIRSAMYDLGLRVMDKKIQHGVISTPTKDRSSYY